MKVNKKCVRCDYLGLDNECIRKKNQRIKISNPEEYYCSYFKIKRYMEIDIELGKYNDLHPDELHLKYMLRTEKITQKEYNKKLAEIKET